MVGSGIYEEAYFIYSTVFNWDPMQLFSVISNVYSGVSVQIENYPYCIILENFEAQLGSPYKEMSQYSSFGRIKSVVRSLVTLGVRLGWNVVDRLVNRGDVIVK